MSNKCMACRIAEIYMDVLCRECHSTFDGASVLALPVLQRLAARIGGLEDEIMAKDFYIDDLESEVAAQRVIAAVIDGEL